MKLLTEDGKTAGLYAICKHLVDTYPDDIYTSEHHPICMMRDQAKKILAMRKEKDMR